MSAPYSTPPIPEDFGATEAQVDQIRSMFGTPRLPLEPVLHGSSADEVVSNPRIVIVDDERINIKVVQKYLTLAGYEQFFTTTEATKAMDLIQAEHPDVVLLDIMMPHVSGLEILENLRGIEQFVDLPVIILTAANDRDTKLAALRLGATEFLGKPVDSVELESRLRNVLSVKAHQDRIKNYAWELELEVAVRSTELAQAHAEVIQCLAKVGEYRDNETGNHVFRVGRYAEIIAHHLGLNKEIVGRIGQAAPLHDIGKVGIPDSVLLKPGKLDETEFQQMKEHCDYGEEVCSAGPRNPRSGFRSHTTAGADITKTGTSPILRMAATIAHTHHEKWDGSGYPRGLAGDEIPIEGRITAVADVFDALTSHRPYKPAFSLEKSLAIIKEGKGKHFDPAVVEAFFAATDEIVSVYYEFTDVEVERPTTADPA
jgi:putative two-component system response regulator